MEGSDEEIQINALLAKMLLICKSYSKWKPQPFQDKKEVRVNERKVFTMDDKA
jgi:hypothetical protein